MCVHLKNKKVQCREKGGNGLQSFSQPPTLPSKASPAQGKNPNIYLTKAPKLFFPNSPKLEASAQSQARPDQAKEKVAAAELGNGYEASNTPGGSKVGSN